MVGASVFGKIPAFGDFVARGVGSETGRAFERWLQMANEQLFNSKAELPPGPLGFMYRAPKADTLLLGVMVPSCDKVGRVFPLTLFYELSAPAASEVACLPGALFEAFGELADTASLATQITKSELEERAAAAAAPEPAALRERLHDQQLRLQSCSLSTLLERLFDGDGAYYAMSVLLRACESAGTNPVAQPVVVDAHATSDLELSFWLACAQACLPVRAAPPSAIWDVGASRVLVAMGSPDSNLLNYLRGPRVQYRKLWGTLGPAPDANDRAKTRLPDPVVEAIDGAGSMNIRQFVSMLADGVSGQGRPGVDEAESDRKGS